MFLPVALVVGEIVEHFKASIDHDLGHSGPGFLSTRILIAFVIPFGGFGAVANCRGRGGKPLVGRNPAVALNLKP